MTEQSSGENEQHNKNAKQLVFGDGMGMISSGAMAITHKKHLAVRNAIESHRHGERKPLAISPETVQ
jgi:hypothetical protein